MFGMGGDPTYSSNKSAFDAYAQRMHEAANRYNPYIDRGNQAGQRSLDEYQKNASNPNAIQDQIASGFQMSPYQNYILDQTTRRMNYNGANTGMQGSGAFQRALMDEMQKNTGQFEDNYINRGLGVYGQALSGLDRAAGMGMQGLNAQDALLQEEAGGYLKGQMSDNEANDRNNAASTDMMGSLLGVALPALGTAFGGPAGGMAGGMAAKAMNGGGDGAAGGASGGGSGGNPMASFFGGGAQGGAQMGMPNFKGAALPTPFSEGNFNSGSWSF